MPWGRVDDTLYDHPKLDLLPDEHRLAVVGLNYLAVSWCNRFLTDGAVPRDRVVRLGGTPELADLAVAAGLWENAGSGYQIHDFLVYNDSRAQVTARRQREAERKASYRASKARPNGTSSADEAHVPASVPQGVPPSVPVGHEPDDPDVSRVVSRRVSRDSSRANPDPARPGPTESSKRAPNAQNRAKAAAAPDEKNGTDPRSGVTLTAEQLAAWSTFGPEWDAVKAAWLSKGLRLPPAGSSEDDDTSQRGLLWNILDSRPASLAEWVAEAPGGSARKVIDHVLARWHEVRAEAGVDPEDWFAGPTPSAAAESLANILKRIPGA